VVYVPEPLAAHTGERLAFGRGGDGMAWRTDLPHSGWVYVGVEDLEDPEHVCEMCESAHVRFVHHVTHPKVPETLRVGCVCAGSMCGDSNLPVTKEKEAKSRRTRKQKWLTRKWRKSAKGNLFLRASGKTVTVFEQRDLWNFCVVWSEQTGRFEWQRQEKKAFGQGGYRTPDEAKAAAFDWLNQKA
jgi:hypothetical protein